MIDLLALGLIQGVLEWLPVSSEGFVVLASAFLGFKDPLGIALFLHLGTLLAVIAYFHDDIAKLDKRMVRFIALATAASFVTGLPLYYLAKSLDLSVGPLAFGAVGLALIATGFLVHKRISAKSKNALAGKDAVFAGLLQGTAIMPGISRSGVTLFALLSQGYPADFALKLSFLMSIPVVLAASAFDATQGFAFDASYLPALAVAAVVGYAMIGALIRVAKRVDFSWFCWAFGTLSVVAALLA